MKKLSTLVLMLSLSLVFSLQTAIGQTIKTDFEIRTDQSELRLGKGSEASVSIDVLRSKKYANAKVNFSADLPEGITVSFNPESSIENGKATIKVGNGVDAGTYTLILKGESNNIKKGTMLVLVVN
jgi:hypothetical protein